MQAADNIIFAGLNPWLIRSSRGSKLVLGSNPGRWDVRHRVCAYTVLQADQRPGVCSAVCGTVH